MSQQDEHDALPVTLLDLSSVLGSAYREIVTDGLPTAQMTAAGVDALLARYDAAADEVIGVFPPAYAEVTLRELATYGLLAGAPHSIFPALVAAARAISDPAFNLLAVQTTTSAVGVATVLCGPTLRGMGFYGGSNGSGPGVCANVTLGRAIRLALINIGGAIPDILDAASIGWPGKLGFTIVENEQASPWPSYRVGFLDSAPDANLVVAVPANGFIELTDSKSGSGAELVASFSRMLTFSPATARSDEALIVLTPHHAHLLAGSGYSFSEVQEIVASIMQLSEARKVAIVVSGGTGGKSAHIPLWGESRSCLLPFHSTNLERASEMARTL